MFAPGARYTCYGTEYRVYNMAWGYNLTYTRLYSRGYSYTKIFLEPSPYIAEDIRSHQRFTEENTQYVALFSSCRIKQIKLDINQDGLKVEYASCFERYADLIRRKLLLKIAPKNRMWSPLKLVYF